MKNAKQIERHFKGMANHNRIEILSLVSAKPYITLEGIAEELDKNFKNISEHTRRLVYAGLLNKQYKGRSVVHSLSPYGEKFIKFAKTF